MSPRRCRPFDRFAIYPTAATPQLPPMLSTSPITHFPFRLSIALEDRKLADDHAHNKEREPRTPECSVSTHHDCEIEEAKDDCDGEQRIEGREKSHGRLTVGRLVSASACNEFYLVAIGSSSPRRLSSWAIHLWLAQEPAAWASPNRFRGKRLPLQSTVCSPGERCSWSSASEPRAPPL